MRGMLVLMQKSADPAICHIKLQQEGRGEKIQKREETKQMEEQHSQYLLLNSFSDHVFFYCESHHEMMEVKLELLSSNLGLFYCV